MNLENAIAQSLEPVIDVTVELSKRVKAVESGTTRIAGDAACDNIVKMADSFLRGAPIAVSELPHIAQSLQVLRAYGLRTSDVMPEVQS